MKIHSSEPYGSKSRKTRGETISFELKNVEESLRPDRLLERVFERLIQRVVGTKEPSFIGVQLLNDRMDKSFFIPMRPPRQNSPAAIAQAFEQLSQSDASLNLYGGELQCKIFAVYLPAGGCSDEKKKRKGIRSLVQVINPKDKWCLARSIAIGMAYHRLQEHKPEDFKKFCQEDNQEQEKRARRLLTGAKLSKKKDLYDLNDIRAIQAFLDKTYGESTYQLAVFSREHNNSVLWKKQKTGRNRIYLYFENGHYNFIAKPWQLMNANDFCLECERPVYPGQYHPRQCPAACKRCLRHGFGYPCKKIKDSPATKCKKCGFVFANEDCFRYHRTLHGKQMRTICQKRYICKKCGRVVITRAGKHNCSLKKTKGSAPNKHSQLCSNCGIIHDAERPYCYIQPIEKVDNQNGKRKRTAQQKPKRYVFFDTETTQCTRVKVNGRNAYKHVANLAVAQVLCETCIEAGVKITDPANRAHRPPGCFCGVGHRQYQSRTLIFDSWSKENSDPIDNFLEWLLHSGPANVVTIVLSHNGGKFDMHLCLERLYLKNIPVNLVMTGLKIYIMEIKGRHTRHVIFKDTLNFFFAPLASLPKIFELAVKPKPYFPYLWIRPENLFVELDHLPDMKYYQPENMKVDEHTKFVEWWKKYHLKKKFLLWKALVKYCINDVDIEREAALKFRALLIKMADVDPFVVAGTLAKLALHIYRLHHLPRDTMVNAPEGGFRRHERQSAIALKYMRLFEEQHDVQVQTRNWSVGEARVGDGTGRRLDGYVDRGPNKKPIAIEFLGCYYHGCPECYRNRDILLAGGRTADELYNSTMNRLFELEKLKKYKMHIVWEHDFHVQLRKDKQLRIRFQQIRVPNPLDPRVDCLRGGRTEPFKLYHKCALGEEIVYVDIVSLYPFVMKNRAFPIGYPIIITAEQIKGLPWLLPSDNPFKGLLLVLVLAPFWLLRAVLYYRNRRGRLLFPVCAACAEDERFDQKECTHTDSERMWIGGFTHAEINEALAQGYQIIEVYEVFLKSTFKFLFF